MEHIKELITQALESFEYDPPDTDFQRGYLAAVQWLAAITMEEPETEKPTLN